MNEKDFKTLLESKENQDLDFKIELPKDSKKIAGLVTTLYNSRGGKIIFGVEDETHKPVGLKNPQRTENGFTQIIRHWCKLDEEPEIEFVKYKAKDFIVIHCPKGRNTPYFVKGELKPRVRIGSSNMIANKEEIARPAKRDLLDLKAKKIIRFVGPPKTGYYCLNDTVNTRSRK